MQGSTASERAKRMPHDEILKTIRTLSILSFNARVEAARAGVRAKRPTPTSGLVFADLC